jgi:penicillin-insensitive murein endopeptidase
VLARSPIHTLVAALAALAAAVTLPGCAQLGTVTDGTSLARGYSNDGHLVDGVRLPRQGDGYLIPPIWAKRGNNWGTDELVALVVRAARRVQREAPGPLLYVGDFSPQFGSTAAGAWHRSHQTGRDADLIFFAVDEDGKPQPVPNGMYRFGDDGWTRRPPRLRFDVVHEWLLVRALLEDPGVDVQHLFISAPLRQMLLDHADELGEPRELVERARLVLQQPVDALPHDDHLHVRIFCPVSDRALGCRDRGPLRWFKKTYKYLSARRLVAELPDPLREQVLKPFCSLLAASSVARL